MKAKIIIYEKPNILNMQLYVNGRDFQMWNAKLHIKFKQLLLSED